MQDLIINSGDGAYPVTFLDSTDKVLSNLGKIKNAFFVIDERVLQLYPNIANFLADKTVLKLPATEEAKTWMGVGKVIDWYQKSNCTKSSTVVAIGGGIIQDIVCFSTSVYYRGINWFFVPTTVLSMSDSCIGAKCGINVNQYKNQVGSFNSPKAVLICSEFTKTLDDKDVQSGYGEILKLAITGSVDLYNKLKIVLDSEGLRGPRMLELIRDSLVVKKAVIEADEYEADYRRILNYGHTLGHSLESLSNHDVPHGLAVAWGIDIINFISWKKDLIPESIFKDIHQLIKKHLFYPIKEKVNSEQLISGARRDKKAIGDSVNFVLLGGLGNLKIVKTSFNQELDSLVATYLNEYNVFSRH